MTDDTKTIPALDAVLTPDDTRNKGTGSYSVRYAPWGKISQLLRKHAPGWQPIAIPNDHGFITHEAPDGSRFLMMAFEFTDGRRTQPVPHAIMDNKMNAKKQVDARDVADGFVRGMCKAAALTFGLGIEMWTGDPLDEGEPEPEPVKVKAKPAKPAPKKKPAAALKSSSAAVKSSSADDKRARFSGDDLLSKTKSELIAMIAEAKAERRLEQVDLIKAAKAVGVDYGGGNPALLEIQDLRDIYGALQDVPVKTDDVPF